MSPAEDSAFNLSILVEMRKSRSSAIASRQLKHHQPQCPTILFVSILLSVDGFWRHEQSRTNLKLARRLSALECNPENPREQDLPSTIKMLPGLMSRWITLQLFQKPGSASSSLFRNALLEFIFVCMSHEVFETSLLLTPLTKYPPPDITTSLLRPESHRESFCFLLLLASSRKVGTLLDEIHPHVCAWTDRYFVFFRLGLCLGSLPQEILPRGPQNEFVYCSTHAIQITQDTTLTRLHPASTTASIQGGAFRRRKRMRRTRTTSYFRFPGVPALFGVW